MSDLYLPDPTPAYDTYWNDEEGEELADAPALVGADNIAYHEWSFHSEQFRAWESTKRTKVIVAGRRWGKSEVQVRWALTGAMDDNLRGIPGITWVILPTFNMARSIWRKFLRLAPPGWITRVSGNEKMPDYLEIGCARIEFKSGDHPERLVGEGLRRVAIDEAGLIKERVYSESIMPALMDHSAPAFLTGTPKGKTWFYRLYVRGLDPLDEEVGTFGGPTTQNPYILPSEVERLRKEMPERLFRQEVLAAFLDDDGAVFRGVRECVGPMSTNPTVAYGVDLARKTDYTVIVGMDADKRMTFYDRFHQVGWPLQKKRITEAVQHPRCGGRRPRVLIDATGAGDPIVQDLQAAGMRIEAFLFTPATKASLIDSLSIDIEQQRVRLIDEPVLLNELEAFEFTTTKAGNIRYSAPQGLHDDTVCALALAAKAASRSRNMGISIGEPEDREAKPHPDPDTMVERPWQEVEKDKEAA